MAIQVLDATGNPQTIETLPSVSRKSAALSLPTAMSTEDKVVADAAAASLVSILAKLTADPATQTTLAAILAKLVAAPATEAKQDTLNTLVTMQNGYLDGVEGSLTSILAKIIAAPATEALQTALNAIVTAANGYLATMAGAVGSSDPAPTDEAGNTPFTDNAVDESAGASTVLGAPGKLVWLHVYNPHATDVVWLHVFDATTVTLGTTEPVLRIPWKAGSAGWQTLNLECGLGIKVSAHPTYAKSTTAPAADLVVNIGHRAA